LLRTNASAYAVPDARASRHSLVDARRSAAMAVLVLWSLKSKNAFGEPVIWAAATLPKHTHTEREGREREREREREKKCNEWSDKKHNHHTPRHTKKNMHRQTLPPKQQRQVGTHWKLSGPMGSSSTMRAATSSERSKLSKPMLPDPSIMKTRSTGPRLARSMLRRARACRECCPCHAGAEVGRALG